MILLLSELLSTKFVFTLNIITSTKWEKKGVRLAIALFYSNFSMKFRLNKRFCYKVFKS